MGAGGGEGWDSQKGKGPPGKGSGIKGCPWGPGVAWDEKNIPLLFFISCYFFHKFLLAKMFTVTVCILYSNSYGKPLKEVPQLSDLTQSRRVTVVTDTGYPNRNPRTAPSTHVCEMVCSNRGPSHPALSLRSNKFQQLSRNSNVNHIPNRSPLHPEQRPAATQPESTSSHSNCGADHMVGGSPS